MIPFGRDGGSKKWKKKKRDIHKPFSNASLVVSLLFQTFITTENTRNSNLPHWTTIKVDPAVSRGAAKPVGAD